MPVRKRMKERQGKNQWSSKQRAEGQLAWEHGGKPKVKSPCGLTAGACSLG